MKRVRARHLNCVVCGGSDRVWLFEVWNQAACSKHSYDGTPFCTSCLRFKEHGARFTNVDGNRQFCEECLATCIMDKKRLKEVFHEIRQFFKKLKLKVDKDIPICLVDNGEMENTMRSINTINPKNFMYGLTISSKVDSRIEIKVIKKCTQNGENIDVVKETKQLTNKPKVVCIVIVFGYSRVATAATMAHEMMHAWFRKQGSSYGDGIIEEALCEVISSMWLKETDTFKNGLSQFEQKLRDVEICELEKRNLIPREVRSAIETFGLERTLEEFCKTKKLPSISTCIANLRIR